MLTPDVCVGAHAIPYWLLASFLITCAMAGVKTWFFCPARGLRHTTDCYNSPEPPCCPGDANHLEGFTCYLSDGFFPTSPRWCPPSSEPLGGDFATLFDYVGRVSVVWLLEDLSCSAALESAADPEFHYHDFGFLRLGWTINLGGSGQETLA